MTIKLEIEDVKQKLKKTVRSDFLWPEVPQGWQLEFIAYPNGEVEMDFLHPISGVFWSEENGHFEPPVMNNGSLITAKALKDAGVPFMTTFGHAAVSVQPKQPHLKSI